MRKAICYNRLSLLAFNQMRRTQSRPKVSRDVFPARCLRKVLWSIGVVGCDLLPTHYRKPRRASEMGGKPSAGAPRWKCPQCVEAVMLIEARQLAWRRLLSICDDLLLLRSMLAMCSTRGASSMTLQQRVRRFVEARAPRAVCDDCIADHLALSRKQASATHRIVSRQDRAHRYLGQCSGCCTQRKVTVLVRN